MLLLTIAGFMLLVLLAFGRSLFQGFAPLDDPFLIVGNRAVRGFSGQSLRLAFTTFDPELYIPLTIVSYQVNFLLGGMHPFGFHLLNVLLHAGNALLVVWTLLLLTRNRTAALLAGLLFAVHPLQTEAVSWAAGRKDLLSAFFALLSLIAYLYYRAGSKRAYVASVCSFALSLLAKVSPLMLPFVFLLHDLTLKRRQGIRGMVLDKLPFVALSLGFAIIGAFGKGHILSGSSFLAAILLAGKSIALTAGRLVLPIRLSAYYPSPQPVLATDPGLLLPWALVAAVVILVLLFRRRAPAVTFGVLSFLLLFAPALLYVRHGQDLSFAADRYAYLPSWGVFFLLAAALTRLLSERAHVDVAIPFALVIVAFAALSFQQTGVWASAETLYEHALRLHPESVEVRVNLAETLRREKRPLDAFNLLKDGLEYGEDARLHLHAGYLFAEAGEVPKAREQFDIARSMAPQDPNPPFAIATLDAQTGDKAAARREYEETLALDPSFVAARLHLARFFLEDGKEAEAEGELRTALRWNPGSVDALLSLARLLRTQEGKETEVQALLQTALSIDPENAKAQELTQQRGITIQP